MTSAYHETFFFIDFIQEMGDKKEITQLRNVSRGPYPYYCTRRLGISSKSKLVAVLLYLGARVDQISSSQTQSHLLK
jgi:hypothetical protein